MQALAKVGALFLADLQLFGHGFFLIAALCEDILVCALPSRR
jgi:hypothetical protein